MTMVKVLVQRRKSETNRITAGVYTVEDHPRFKVVAALALATMLQANSDNLEILAANDWHIATADGRSINIHFTDHQRRKDA